MVALICFSLIVPASAAVNYITQSDGHTYTVTNDVLGEATLEYSYTDEETQQEVNVVAPLVYVPIGTYVIAPEGYEQMSIDIWVLGENGWQQEGSAIMSSVCEIDSDQVIAGLAVYNAETEEVGQYIYYLGVKMANGIETASDWAMETVNSAVNAGLVPESLQGDYANNITRAEFCALAVTFYEIYTGAEIETAMAFPDTDDINVGKMGALNVILGNPDGTANPNAFLTREEAATILSRLAAACNQPLEDAEPDFPDNSSLSDWSYAAIGQMQNAGIMIGSDGGNFLPKDPYTREQSIVTLLRMFTAFK